MPDPGLIGRLVRRLTGGSTPATAPAPRRPVQETPFADSVFALGGRPRTLGTARDLPNRPLMRTLGLYTAGADRLELDPTVAHAPPDSALAPNDNGATPRHVLAHEIAHRLDQTLPDRAAPSIDPGYRQAFDAYRANHPTTSQARAGSYAATNEREHFADAFADAVGMLQETAGAYKNPPAFSANTHKDPATAADALHIWAAGRTPGTDTLALELLKRPIYANHPLHAATRGLVRRAMTPGDR